MKNEFKDMVGGDRPPGRGEGGLPNLLGGFIRAAKDALDALKKEDDGEWTVNSDNSLARSRNVPGGQDGGFIEPLR